MIIRPTKRFSLNLHEIWQYRDLLFFLARRDISVRYKQTLLGAVWAILQPFLTMIVFTLIFGGLAEIPSDNIPYPIFTFTALLPWQMFSLALLQSSESLVANSALVSKVYFPRIIIPLASILPPFIDFCVAFFILAIMILLFSISITIKVIFLPLFVVIAMLASLGIGLWLSALNIQYRDFRYVVPFITQFLMYLSPVVYPYSLVPDKWKLVYALNPLVGVIEGFRWALLGTNIDILPLILIASGVTTILLLSGVYYFRTVEKIFADVV